LVFKFGFDLYFVFVIIIIKIGDNYLASMLGDGGLPHTPLGIVNEPMGVGILGDELSGDVERGGNSLNDNFRVTGSTGEEEMVAGFFCCCWLFETALAFLKSSIVLNRVNSREISGCRSTGLLSLRYLRYAQNFSNPYK